jgi:hypothetical protein
MSHFVAWYSDEANYWRFRESCNDKDQFGASYESWLVVAQKKIDEDARGGIVLTKVHLEPEAFLAWCRVNAETPNARSRSKFAGVVYGSGQDAGGAPTH